MLAMGMALIVAIPLALVAAYRAEGRFDRLTSAGAFAAISVPPFLIALLLVFFFVFHVDIVRGVVLAAGLALAAWAGWRTVKNAAEFPPGADRRRSAAGGGLMTLAIIGVTVLLFANFPDFPRQGFSRWTDEAGIYENLRSVFLPALTLAIAEIAVFMRLLRGDLISTLQEDYILSARAKGMPARRIIVLRRPATIVVLAHHRRRRGVRPAHRRHRHRRDDLQPARHGHPDRRQHRRQGLPSRPDAPCSSSPCSTCSSTSSSTSRTPTWTRGSAVADSEILLRGSGSIPIPLQEEAATRPEGPAPEFMGRSRRSTRLGSRDRWPRRWASDCCSSARWSSRTSSAVVRVAVSLVGPGRDLCGDRPARQADLRRTVSRRRCGCPSLGSW